jgi:hypothetical protein
MKKLFFFLQGSAFIATNFFLLFAVMEFVYEPDHNIIGLDTPVYDQKEEFDPSLLRLNNVTTLMMYCDSLYDESVASDKNSWRFEEEFPSMASTVVRKRFYHGYSYYGWRNNYMAGFFSKVMPEGLNAIVIPDDILKYPYAACSQQSIVLMQLLKRKGFNVRKVTFQGKMGGHFCFEAFYNGSWHFFDPDMEPDNELLAKYNRPSVTFLSNHKDIMLHAYRQYPEDKMMDLFSSFSLGNVNSPAAPKAFLFQKISKFLSYTLWTFFLVLFILARKKYLRLRKQGNVRNHRIYFPKLQPGTPGMYNLDY